MVSALTLTMIGIDRYMAVKKPLQSRRNGSQSKSYIVIIWMISSSFSLIPFVTSHARDVVLCGQEITVCGDDFAAITRVEMYYQLLLLICECVIPLSILAYTYSVVCLKLWGRTLPGNADHNRDLTVTRNKKKTIKMLISIVVLFAVCLMPMQLYHFIGMLHSSSLTANSERMLFFFYYTSHWLGMIHSGINPIIYGFMNENFRVSSVSSIDGVLLVHAVFTLETSFPSTPS
ncbi:RYamide receptor [Holothuria leucospilota]|uniref:RYamide receptor n=1 Tax=Holothuria leucospilota TaxID=206669 RepID=A0A9Q1BEB4_HOLLE|nr:RYamide receptor [Holothuria leucospilota]